MELVTLWIALGLAVLVHCGIEETVALLAFDYQGQIEETGQAAQIYFALCLTVLVIAWPMVLMEMVRGDQQR